MTKKKKIPFSTTIPSETRQHIEDYAREHNINLSEALQVIIAQWRGSSKIESLNIPLNLSDIAEIKTRLENIETQIKYSNYRYANLPCVKDIK